MKIANNRLGRLQYGMECAQGLDVIGNLFGPARSINAASAVGECAQTFWGILVLISAQMLS